MISSDLRKALIHKWPKRVRNGAAEVIPPYACMRILSAVAVDGELVFTCAKPNATPQNSYLVNGPFSIGTGSTDEGLASTLSDPGYVMYDTGSPAVNAEWGPEDGEWALTTTGTGFTITGGSTTLAGNTVVSAVQGISGTSPDVLDLVQVWKPSGSPQVGDIVEPNASLLHPGFIKEWNIATEVFDDGDPIWINFVDYYDEDTGDIFAEHGRYYGPAILQGTFDVAGDERPMYHVHIGSQTFLAKNSGSEIAKGSSGSLDLWHRQAEADSTFNITAKALGAAIPASKFVTVQRIGRYWYVGCYES